MGCTYEEEIYRKYGKVEECGCRNCPYKNLEECKEVWPDEWVIPEEIGLK